MYYFCLIGGQRPARKEKNLENYHFSPSQPGAGQQHQTSVSVCFLVSRLSNISLTEKACISSDLAMNLMFSDVGASSFDNASALQGLAASSSVADTDYDTVSNVNVGVDDVDLRNANVNTMISITASTANTGIANTVTSAAAAAAAAPTGAMMANQCNPLSPSRPCCNASCPQQNGQPSCGGECVLHIGSLVLDTQQAMQWLDDLPFSAKSSDMCKVQTIAEDLKKEKGPSGLVMTLQLPLGTTMSMRSIPSPLRLPSPNQAFPIADSPALPSWDLPSPAPPCLPSEATVSDVDSQIPMFTFAATQALQLDAKFKGTAASAAPTTVIVAAPAFVPALAPAPAPTPAPPVAVLASPALAAAAAAAAAAATAAAATGTSSQAQPTGAAFDEFASQKLENFPVVDTNAFHNVVVMMPFEQSHCPSLLSFNAEPDHPKSEVKGERAAAGGKRRHKRSPSEEIADEKQRRWEARKRKERSRQEQRDVADKMITLFNSNDTTQVKEGWEKFYARVQLKDTQRRLRKNINLIWDASIRQKVKLEIDALSPLK